MSAAVAAPTAALPAAPSSTAQALPPVKTQGNAFAQVFARANAPAAAPQVPVTFGGAPPALSQTAFNAARDGVPAAGQPVKMMFGAPRPAAAAPSGPSVFSNHEAEKAKKNEMAQNLFDSLRKGGK